MVLSHFSTSLKGKNKREDKGKGRGAAAPHPNFSEGETDTRLGLGISSRREGNTDILPHVTMAHPGKGKNTEPKRSERRIKRGDKKHRFKTRRGLTTTKGGPSHPARPTKGIFFSLRWGLRDRL